MQPKAYTVGNPEAYETFLDEDPNPRKSKGGIVFLTRVDAEEVVKDGFLPSEWFDGRVMPGRVYGLICDPSADVEEGEHGLKLKRHVPVTRLEEE